MPEVADQGARTDLHAAVLSLRAGGLRRVADEHPDELVKFHRGLAFLDMFRPRAVRSLPTVFLYFGPTGCGKTRTALERTESMGLSLYKHEPRSQWFDGYWDQEVFLLDEYSGWFKLDFLLGFLDRYECRLAIKGAHVQLVASTIYITCNIHPGAWYDYTRRGSQYAAIQRRVSGVVVWRPDGERELAGSELARFWSVDTCGPLSVAEWM